MCYSVEKLLKDSADKIDQADKDILNQKIENLRKKLSENNIEEIKKAKDELQSKMFEVSSKLYQASQQQNTQNQANNNQNNNQNSNQNQNQNVYDADYKDVNNNEKK